SEAEVEQRADEPALGPLRPGRFLRAHLLLLREPPLLPALVLLPLRLTREGLLRVRLRTGIGLCGLGVCLLARRVVRSLLAGLVKGRLLVVHRGLLVGRLRLVGLLLVHLGLRVGALLVSSPGLLVVASGLLVVGLFLLLVRRWLALLVIGRTVA